MPKVSVRYIVGDVDAAIAFYTEQLGFERVVSSSRSGVIHCAVQSVGSSSPISQNAGLLHGDARPPSSQTRTCQK